MKIHHVGYLVKDMEAAKKEFLALGYGDAKITRDEYRGIDICFMENSGYIVELISPYRDDSMVSGLIKKYKNSPYHICYICDNLEEEIAKLAENGYVQMGESREAPAIHGHRVVFMMNGDIGIIEIVEGDADELRKDL